MAEKIDEYFYRRPDGLDLSIVEAAIECGAFIVFRRKKPDGTPRATWMPASIKRCPT